MNRSALLQALAEHPDGIGGQRLAERFGVTRAAVWKEIEALRQEQLIIEGGRGGYQLKSPAGWGPSTLSWRVGRPVEWLAVCSSTNRIARDRAAELPASVPADMLPVIVADHQTAGRGRRGRVWQAEPGASLLFSMVLRPSIPPHEAPRAVLAWAAAMAEVLDVGLKWPNDLVVREADRMLKVGGILAELDTSSEAFSGPGRTHSVVLGVGINVSQQSFDGLPDATSLALLGRPVADRAALLGRLVRAIDAIDLNTPDLLDPWRKRAVMLGESVVVGDVRGTATGIRDDGALLVDGQAVLTGDVSLVSSGPPKAR